MRIQNLYVKLHPDSYAKNIPYDSLLMIGMMENYTKLNRKNNMNVKN